MAGWTADQVQTGLQDNARLGFAGAEQIRGTFLDFIAQGDESCPPGGSNFGASHCMAASGVAFSGISIFQDSSSVVDASTIRQWTHVGDYVLTRVDGTRFESGGGLVSQATIGEDEALVSLNLRGSWVDEGATPGWFREGVSWLVLAEGRRDLAGAELVVDGGITTERALFFEGTRFSSEQDCPISGGLRVQGDDGYWYTWQADCDGCGGVSFQDGTDLGEICPDLGLWTETALQLVPELAKPHVPPDTGLEDEP